MYDVFVFLQYRTAGERYGGGKIYKTLYSIPISRKQPLTRSFTSHFLVIYRNRRVCFPFYEMLLWDMTLLLSIGFATWTAVYLPTHSCCLKSLLRAGIFCENQPPTFHIFLNFYFFVKSLPRELIIATPILDGDNNCTLATQRLTWVFRGRAIHKITCK